MMGTKRHVETTPESPDGVVYHRKGATLCTSQALAQQRREKNEQRASLVQPKRGSTYPPSTKGPAVEFPCTVAIATGGRRNRADKGTCTDNIIVAPNRLPSRM